MASRSSRYGWVRDLPDHRDHVLTLAPQAALPASVDLRPLCPAVYNQGDLGSCTANAIGAAIEFDQRKQKLVPLFTPSRLFIYYNERALTNQTAFDSGAQIRDGIKVVASQGACPEPQWPYMEARLTIRPTAGCYATAKQHPAVSYSRVTQSLSDMKTCLAAGFPFVFGFTVFPGFESPEVQRTGQLDLPTSSDAPIGGHAVMAVGYNDVSNRFLIRNSWGAAWGMGGDFTMPYAYATNPNLASDLWTIRTVK